jgi:hypothetical protein
MKQRRYFVGVDYIRYRDGAEENFTSTSDDGGSAHITFETVFYLSLICLWWGGVGLFVLKAWVL